MTNFEKFLLSLVILYFAAHAAARWGAAAGLSAGVISAAESLVTI
jgi:hypothetical protein